MMPIGSDSMSPTITITNQAMATPSKITYPSFSSTILPPMAPSSRINDACFGQHSVFRIQLAKIKRNISSCFVSDFAGWISVPSIQPSFNADYCWVLLRPTQPTSATSYRTRHDGSSGCRKDHLEYEEQLLRRAQNSSHLIHCCPTGGVKRGLIPPLR